MFKIVWLFFLCAFYLTQQKHTYCTEKDADPVKYRTGKKRKFLSDADYKTNNLSKRKEGVMETINRIDSSSQIETEYHAEFNPNKRFKNIGYETRQCYLSRLPLDLKKYIFFSLLTKREQRKISSTNKEWRLLLNNYYNDENLKRNHKKWKEDFSDNTLFVLNEEYGRFLGLYINLRDSRGNIEDYDIFKKIYQKICKFPFSERTFLLKKYPDILVKHIESINTEENINKVINKKDFLNSCRELDTFFDKKENNYNINEFAIKAHYYTFIKNKNISLGARSCSFLDCIINYERLKYLQSIDGLSISPEFYSVWYEIIHLDSGPTINSLRAMSYLHHINSRFEESYYYYSVIYKNIKHFGEFINPRDVRNIFKSFVASNKYHKAIKIFNKHIMNRYYVSLTDLYTLRYVYKKTGQKYQLIEICKKIINMLKTFSKDEDYICLADAYFGLEQYAKSIFYYKKTKINTSTTYKIMLSYINLKQYEDALKYGVKLTKLPTSDISNEKIKTLLFAFTKSKNYPESVSLSRKYIEILGDTCTSDDLRNASYINYLYGNTENSLEYYEFVARRKDATIYDYLNAGYILFKTNQYEKEKKYFYNALEISKLDSKLKNVIIQYIIRLIKTPPLF